MKEYEKLVRNLRTNPVVPGSRLIDAELLKEVVNNLPDCPNGFSDTYDKACFIDLIDEQPTVDAVEVVRCRDCWRYDLKYEFCSYLGYVCDDGDFFCADGERREVNDGRPD